MKCIQISISGEKKSTQYFVDCLNFHISKSKFSIFHGYSKVSNHNLLTYLNFFQNLLKGK